MSAEPVERSAVEMMRHALGWPRRYRNNYCTGRGSLEFSQWSGLVALGLAKFGVVINDGRDQYFHLTPAGIEYLTKLEAKP